MAGATLTEIRDRAPTPLYMEMFDHLLKPVPALNFLRWESTTDDQKAYRRRRGLSTAPHYSPDATLSAGTAETFDPLTARIRPFGGQVEEPVIGTGHGSNMEQAEAKVIAAAKQFGESFINGGFADNCSIPDLLACDTITAGPYWDVTSRGVGAVLKIVVAGAGASSIGYLKAFGDTGYGAAGWYWGVYATGVKAEDTTSTDIAVKGDGYYVFKSANTNKWVIIKLDESDITDVNGTYFYEITFASTNNTFDGCLKFVDSSMEADVATNGAITDISHLDTAIRLMKTPGRKVVLLSETRFDYMLAAFRDLGGATVADTASLNGRAFPYRGATVMSDPFIVDTKTVGTSSGVCSDLIGIDVDYGLRGLFKTGVPVTGQYDGKSYGGLYVRSLGESHTADNIITRVTWYASIAHLDTQGLCVLHGLLAP